MIATLCKLPSIAAPSSPVTRSRSRNFARSEAGNWGRTAGKCESYSLYFIAVDSFKLHYTRHASGVKLTEVWLYVFFEKILNLKRSAQPPFSDITRLLLQQRTVPFMSIYLKVLFIRGVSMFCSCSFYPSHFHCCLLIYFSHQNKPIA